MCNIRHAVWEPLIQSNRRQLTSPGSVPPMPQEACGKGLTLPACQWILAKDAECLPLEMQAHTARDPQKESEKDFVWAIFGQAARHGPKMAKSRVVGTFWLAGEPFSWNPRVSGQRKRQDGNGQLCDLMATSPEFATYTREEFHMCCLILGW